jgi:hypothetical protein
MTPLRLQFKTMMRTQEPRELRNYPVAAAGINIAWTLAVSILHLDAGGGAGAGAGAVSVATRAAPYWTVRTWWRDARVRA